jgi:hypothetical protein
MTPPHEGISDRQSDKFGLPVTPILLGLGVALTLRKVKMIEAVAAFLALLSAGVFVAHAIDAYTHMAKVNETVRNREDHQCS